MSYCFVCKWFSKFKTDHEHLEVADRQSRSLSYRDTQLYLYEKSYINWATGPYVNNVAIARVYGILRNKCKAYKYERFDTWFP